MQQVKEEETAVHYLEENFVPVDYVPKQDEPYMYWHGWGGDSQWPLPVLAAESDQAGRFALNFAYSPPEQTKGITSKPTSTWTRLKFWTANLKWSRH